MNVKAVFLVIITTFLVSFAQLCYKLGVVKLNLSFSGIFLNYYLLLGLFLYGIGAAILIVALKKDELSTLYPIIATGYIWVLILSKYFLNEQINYLKWFGVIAIVLGIVFVGWGSRTEQLVLE